MSALKSVGSSGQITLGKRFAGQRFLVEELGNGELLLRPMRLVPGQSEQFYPDSERSRFRIAEVEFVVMSSR